MPANDLYIANEIRRQLGVRTLAMLGAHNLLGGPDFLQFSIKGSKKANKISITLNNQDTYDVEFYKIGRAPYFHVTTLAQIYHVHVDQLHEIIERYTGLDTHLI